MHSEPVKIVTRRFIDKPLESILLILAVGLGIGVLSTGLSLLANTLAYSDYMMKSPEYTEITVSTRSDAEDMETPAVTIPASENTVLTQEDLEAAELAPYVEYAYIKNRSRLHMINESSIEQENRMRTEMEQFGPGQGQDSPPQDFSGDAPAAPDGQDGNQPPDMRQNAAQMLQEGIESGLIIAEIEEADGFEVSSGFFDAWDIQTVYGSIFSEQEYASTENIILLGTELAAEVIPEGEEMSSLIGRQLLTRGGYQTIVGIFDSEYGDYSGKFLEPYRDRGSLSGFRGFRGPGMDTSLIFSVMDPEKIESSSSLLTQWFADRYGNDQISISNSRAEAENIVSRNTGISVLVFFLSAAGFFIALLNVSNILMSRAMRMKGATGVLMALGSDRKGILKLFSVEAAVITAAGAAAGMLIAFPLSAYIKKAMEIQTSSFIYLILGIVISGLLALVFSIIPAAHAAKTDPAQAMRAL